MEWIWIFLLLILFAVVLLKIKPSVESTNYRKRGPLFTAAERSFLGVLEKSIAPEHRVMGKVRIADILTPEKGLSRKRWQIAFNKISAKHFDFVICTRTSLEPVLVIELDDRSHKRHKITERDALVDGACKSAGLRLVRFKAQKTYRVSKVMEALEAGKVGENISGTQSSGNYV